MPQAIKEAAKVPAETAIMAVKEAGNHVARSEQVMPWIGIPYYNSQHSIEKQWTNTKNYETLK